MNHQEYLDSKKGLGKLNKSLLLLLISTISLIFSTTIFTLILIPGSIKFIWSTRDFLNIQYIPPLGELYLLYVIYILSGVSLLTISLVAALWAQTEDPVGLIPIYDFLKKREALHKFLIKHVFRWNYYDGSQDLGKYESREAVAVKININRYLKSSSSYYTHLYHSEADRPDGLLVYYIRFVSVAPWVCMLFIPLVYMRINYLLGPLYTYIMIGDTLLYSLPVLALSVILLHQF